MGWVGLIFSTVIESHTPGRISVRASSPGRSPSGSRALTVDVKQYRPIALTIRFASGNRAEDQRDAG